MEKISFELRVYESVDDKSLRCLPWDISQKSTSNRIPESNVYSPNPFES